MPTVKDKERNLTRSKRKKISYLQAGSYKSVSWFLKRNFAGYKVLSKNIQSDEKQGPTAKITLSSKDII